MTREEALMLIQAIPEKTWDRLSKYEREAFGMAFEALNAEGDTISRQAAIDAMNGKITVTGEENAKAVQEYIRSVSLKIHDLPSAQPEIIRCMDCKHNPKDEWFGCPMAHLSEKQRPDDAWCWKGERRTDE